MEFQLSGSLHLHHCQLEIIQTVGVQCSYRGFFVTSYQANFASHHIRNRHVGFLLKWHGIEKYNKMFRYFLFSPYYNTKLHVLA